MLDTASLEAIAIEARNCFLDEDAPEYLKMLTQGIADLKTNLTKSSTKTQKKELENIFKELGRAAHSIKGGAGMAQMPILSQLAHKIEDIFEALEQNRITDKETAIQLLVVSIEEVENLVEAEIHNTEIDHKSTQELIDALAEFLTTASNPVDSVEIGFANDDFIKTALNTDLEACIERVEEMLNTEESQEQKSIYLNESLNILQEECNLLGQALNCLWLEKFASQLTYLRNSNQIDIINLTSLAIFELRHLRNQFLEQSIKTPKLSEKFKQLLPQEKKNKITDKKIVEKQIKTTNLRIPVDKIIQMSDNLGELLIYYERLKIHENQFKQASSNLKKRTKSLIPLKEQIETIYDHLTVDSNDKNQEKKEINQFQNLFQPEYLTEFDTLEFDEYNQVHSVLQNITELIVQVREIREDVDVLNREFQETLIGMRESLDYLDKDITQIRLIPFINLAGSFFSPIEKLNKQHHKSVELIIEGKQTLIDQTIIETLRTPFNHIIRNAFDHGIESFKDRKKAGKTRESQIKLEAKLKTNNVIIQITDDGQGIDIDKVYQKGVSLKLIPANIPRNKLTQEQILDLIFSPGFSTATKVTDLSGRGMGMDIVKAEIEKLRGTIKVKTQAGKGTQFTLTIPLGLNIIPLLLIRCQQQILAIPSDYILRIARFSDHQINNDQILWDDQLISIYSLYKILPYNSSQIFSYTPEKSIPNIGLLLKIGNENIFLAVDEILDEKELVTKPFDQTVPVPAYISGCTVLGNGEVVPIIIPDYIKNLFLKSSDTIQEDTKINNNEILNQLSILVIDDSIAVRRTLDRLLTQVGYQVVQCKDGKEAWNLLEITKQKFNLAICDLEMPKYDGFKVLQLVRNSAKWQHLPFIILTSRDSDLHRNKAKKLGATSYVTKPFNPLKMIEIVEQSTLLRSILP